MATPLIIFLIPNIQIVDRSFFREKPVELLQGEGFEADTFKDAHRVRASLTLIKITLRY